MLIENMPARPRREMLEEITQVLEHAFSLSQRFRVLLGCYAVIIIMRLFKGYDSNPRLAQVRDASLAGR